MPDGHHWWYLFEQPWLLQEVHKRSGLGIILKDTLGVREDESEFDTQHVIAG